MFELTAFTLSGCKTVFFFIFITCYSEVFFNYTHIIPGIHLVDFEVLGLHFYVMDTFRKRRNVS